VRHFFAAEVPIFFPVGTKKVKSQKINREKNVDFHRFCGRICLRQKQFPGISKKKFISPVLSPTSDSTALSKAIPDHFETEREKKMLLLISGVLKHPAGIFSTKSAD
jgi:hypothetical protein